MLEAVRSEVDLSGDLLRWNVWLKIVVTAKRELEVKNPAKKLKEFFRRELIGIGTRGFILGTRKFYMISPSLRGQGYASEGLIRGICEIAEWW